MLATVFSNELIISLTMSAVILLLLILYPVFHKKYTAKWRYWVWLLVAVRLLIPWNPSFPKAPIRITQPAQTITFTLPAQNAAAAGQAVQSAGQTAGQTAGQAGQITTQVVPYSLTLFEILSMVWVLGMIVFVVYHIAGYGLFRRSVARLSRPVDDPRTLAIWERVQAKRKNGHSIRIWRCKFVQSPMMTGFFRPVLLLPCLDFDSDELEIILIHELIHYERKDIWYKLLLVCENAVHWFNPLMYVMAAMSNRDIEMVCDLEIVNNKDIMFRKQYGHTILSAIHKQNLRKTAFSTNFYGGKTIMKERFDNIFDTQKKHRGIAAFCILAVTVCMAGGLVACRGLTTAVNYTSEPTSESGTSADTSTVSAATTSTAAAEATTATADGTTTASGSSVPIGDVVYKNTQYGFEVLLPESWKGYKVLEDKWTGTEGSVTKTGPELILRNPTWTSSVKYQDIPIMIFTLKEWQTVVKGPSQGAGETLFIGAGPNGPTELARNASYVFALPNRYDFAADKGIEEVHAILDQNPVRPLS